MAGEGFARALTKMVKGTRSGSFRGAQVVPVSRFATLRGPQGAASPTMEPHSESTFGASQLSDGVPQGLGFRFNVLGYRPDDGNLGAGVLTVATTILRPDSTIPGVPTITSEGVATFTDVVSDTGSSGVLGWRTTLFVMTAFDAGAGSPPGEGSVFIQSAEAGFPGSNYALVGSYYYWHPPAGAAPGDFRSTASGSGSGTSIDMVTSEITPQQVLQLAAINTAPHVVAPFYTDPIVTSGAADWALEIGQTPVVCFDPITNVDFYTMNVASAWPGFIGDPHPDNTLTLGSTVPAAFSWVSGALGTL